MELVRLKAELDIYKLKEEKWLRKWQQIAFHVRQKGLQMSSIDKVLPDDAELPSETEATQILRPFDQKIPPSGRV
ncbi:hypothetical protein SMQE32_37470 [Serratia marcescens]|nr:hypothetical protein SMQE32_37470 [Serratia marcescens]